MVWDRDDEANCGPWEIYLNKVYLGGSGAAVGT